MPISEAYHINCMEYMDKQPDKRFSVGIPDPPYGIGESSKNHKSRNTPIVQKNGAILRTKQPNYGTSDWDAEIPPPEYFVALFRVTVHQIIWGANYFPSICGVPFKPPRRHEYEQFIKDHPTNWIIWDKVNSTNDFNDCELAWTSFPVPTQVFYFMWNGMMQGVSADQGRLMQGNKKLNEKRIHPTQKPLALYHWLYTIGWPRNSFAQAIHGTIHIWELREAGLWPISWVLITMVTKKTRSISKMDAGDFVN